MKNAASCETWCELQNTLSTNFLNAHCGLGFCPGPRLSEGRIRLTEEGLLPIDRSDFTVAGLKSHEYSRPVEEALPRCMSVWTEKTAFSPQGTDLRAMRRRRRDARQFNGVYPFVDEVRPDRPPSWTPMEGLPVFGRVLNAMRCFERECVELPCRGTPLPARRPISFGR